MKLPKYIGEWASLKLLVFIIVYMFIFTNNKNRVMENFREENLEYAREIRAQIKIVSGYMELTSDSAHNLYMEHYGKDEAHLGYIEIEPSVNIGLSLTDERGERLSVTSFKEVVDLRAGLQTESEIAYRILQYSKSIIAAIESDIWIYYYSVSGVLSEYPRQNFSMESDVFQEMMDLKESNYKKGTMSFDLITGRKKDDIVVHMVIPVYYREKLVGILSGNIKPNIHKSSGINVYILDREGNLIFSNSQEKLNKDITVRLNSDEKINGIERIGKNYVWISQMENYNGLLCYTLPISVVYYTAFTDSIILMLVAFILYLSQRDLNKRREVAGEREILIAQLVEARRDLEETSEQDYLTKLLNRRGFLKRAESEYSRFKRHGGVFSLILCDIDFFKKFNDNYGHECGDTVLKEVSKMFRKNIRESDLVGRWGGEEFIFLLIESRGYPAYQRAEVLRKAVEENIFKYREKKLNITISFGVYQVNPDLSLEENINVADRALYLSKNNGRNRVEIIVEPKI